MITKITGGIVTKNFDGVDRVLQINEFTREELLQEHYRMKNQLFENMSLDQRNLIYENIKEINFELQNRVNNDCVKTATA